MRKRKRPGVLLRRSDERWPGSRGCPDKATLDRFKTGEFALAAQVSAVAVKAGASETADYSSGVAVFTRPNGGLMYEASVGGQKFRYNDK